MQQIPEYAKGLYMHTAHMQNFLHQHQRGNVLTEIQKLTSRLSEHRDPTLNDGRDIKTRIKYLEDRRSQSQPHTLAGLEGLDM